MSDSYCRKNYYQLTIQQGATLNLSMTWEVPAGTPVDLTTFDARMQIRETAASTTIIFELTVSNSRIVLGGINGTIALIVAAADTATIDAGSYVYDLELISPGGDVTRLLEGDAIVTAEVTR